MRLEDAEAPILVLELESETLVAGDAPADKRHGIWIFIGKRFARIVGPAMGSQQLITGTLCSSLAVLRRIRGKGVDEELGAKYEALLGELERPGFLKITQRVGGKAAEADEVLYDESNAELGGSVSRRDGCIGRRLGSEVDMISVMSPKPLLAHDMRDTRKFHKCVKLDSHDSQIDP